MPLKLTRMEVHFTHEQEARLLKIATHEGIDPAQLVKEAALRLLEDDTRFGNAVRQGIEQADCGQLSEEDEMDARVRRLFPS
jgi:predicted transcriptional regulator